MNTSLLIELKSDYTTILKQILGPLILEGLQSIYKSAQNVCDKNNVLKSFQLLLKKIPDWTMETITHELERINTLTSNSYPWLIQLVQATFKINILIHDLEPTDQLLSNITYGKFIHQIYIECYKIFWRDPFLFYHDYTPLEQKKNNLLVIENIEKAIDNAIRRLLPISMILEKFVGNNNATDLTNLYNIPVLLQVELVKTNVAKDVSLAVSQAVLSYLQEKMPQSTPMVVPPKQVGSGDNDNSNNIVLNDTLEKNVNNQILNIINKNKIISDTNENENNHFTVNNHTNHNSLSDKRTSSTLKKIINESLRNSHNNNSQKSMKQGSNHSHRTLSNSENSNIKNKILKELDTETVSYNPDENNNYQDVFSNSDVKNTINTNEKHEKKSREKFFNNYLNI